MQPKDIKPFPNDFRHIEKDLKPVPIRQVSEFTTPCVLIGIAIAIYVGIGLFNFGAVGGVFAFGRLLAQALGSVLLGVVACFLTGMILGTNFGKLSTACLKLVAATLFPIAFTALLVLLALPSVVIAPIVVLLLFASLLKFLFDLELFDLFVLVLVYVGVSFLVERALLWLGNMG